MVELSSGFMVFDIRVGLSDVISKYAPAISSSREAIVGMVGNLDGFRRMSLFYH